VSGITSQASKNTSHDTLLRSSTYFYWCQAHLSVSLSVSTRPRHKACGNDGGVTNYMQMFEMWGRDDDGGSLTWALSRGSSSTGKGTTGTWQREPAEGVLLQSHGVPDVAPSDCKGGTSATGVFRWGAFRSAPGARRAALACSGTCAARSNHDCMIAAAPASKHSLQQRPLQLCHPLAEHHGSACCRQYRRVQLACTTTHPETASMRGVSGVGGASNGL
jgi:hypothetical protein